MCEIRIWRRNWIILAAICVHAIWGLMLLFTQSPLFTTPLAGLNYLPAWVAGVILIVAAGLAMVPLVVPRFDTPWAAFWFVALQQWLMMLGFWTAMLSVFHGSYPDGYIPTKYGNPHFFIFVDQLWPIVGMLAHTFSLIDWVWYSRIRTDRGNFS